MSAPSSQASRTAAELSSRCQPGCRQRALQAAAGPHPNTVLAAAGHSAWWTSRTSAGLSRPDADRSALASACAVPGVTGRPQPHPLPWGFLSSPPGHPALLCSLTCCLLCTEVLSAGSCTAPEDTGPFRTTHMSMFPGLHTDRPGQVCWVSGAHPAPGGRPASSFRAGFLERRMNQDPKETPAAAL